MKTDYGRTALYTLTVNGREVPVERVEKFQGAVVQYAAVDDACQEPLQFRLITDFRIEDFSISPRRAGIPAYVKENCLYFTLDRPCYLVIQLSGQEDLFVLVDDPEKSRPFPGDGETVSITDYIHGSFTEKTDLTEIFNRAAADVAQSAVWKTLYIPAGHYLTGEIRLGSHMTLYLEKAL